MSNIFGAILPLIGSAAGFVGSGFNPAGAIAGYQVGSGLAGITSGNSSQQPQNWGTLPGGIGAGQQRTNEDMFKTPSSVRDVVLGEPPQFAPQPRTKVPGSGTDKASMIQMGLQQASMMDDRQRSQQSLSAETSANNAIAAERMYPYRNPGAAPIIGASPGQYQGVSGGFRFNR